MRDIQPTGMVHPHDSEGMGQTFSSECDNLCSLDS